MLGPRFLQNGFTLLELMLALVISSVLLAFAVPSMQSFLGDSEIAATSNRFVHSLQTARSEAIKRSGPVGLCPSTDSLDADPSCGGGDYTRGWIVFLDDNANGTREAVEEVILQSAELPGAFTFTPDAMFSERIYFSEAGTSINPAGIPLSGTVQIDFALAEQRTINIAANGRISTDLPDATGGP